MSNEQPIPDKCDIAIIGGGPGGSAAATLLGEKGYQVVLFEKEKFPRQQVGESLLPHLWDYTDRLGVSDKIRAENFMRKAGGIIAWNGVVHQLSFSNFGYTDGVRVGINVERDLFDDILLRHAEEYGAAIFEQVNVTNVDFSDEQWPVVNYQDRRGGSFQNGQIKARYVIDASGYLSLLARQFKTRRLVGDEKKYLGVWAHFDKSLYMGVDAELHQRADMDQVLPTVFVSSFKDGWIWHIPLREKTSVGLVVNVDHIRGRGRAAQERYLLQSCAQTPIIRDLMSPAELIDETIGFRPDYSYYSTKIVGQNFYCIGDAGAFVDPVFSQGVQAAFFNAAIATWAIDESFKNEARRQRISELAEMQMLRFYGFSRMLVLGDFGGDGVDPVLAKAFMKSLPPQELELAMAAAYTTDRSGNLHRMVQEAGLAEEFPEGFGRSKLTILKHLSHKEPAEALGLA